MLFNTILCPLNGMLFVVIVVVTVAADYVVNVDVIVVVYYVLDVLVDYVVNVDVVVIDFDSVVVSVCMCCFCSYSYC